MKTNIYTTLLSLRIELIENIRYAESVIEAVGEPCDGFCERLSQTKILLEQIEAHIKFLETPTE